MADYFDALWDSLETKISSTWSDATKVYRATQSRRINWRELLNQGDIVAPFVAVAIGRAEPSETAAVTSRAHEVPIALYYVRKGVLTVAEKATYPIVERLLEKKGKDMVDALLDSTDASYQVFMEPTVDAGDTNPANQEIMESNPNLIALEVGFTVLVGEN